MNRAFPDLQLLSGFWLFVAAAGPAFSAVNPHDIPRPATTAARSAIPADVLNSAARIEIAPGKVTLDGPTALQHLVVTLFSRDGSTCDVTDRATLSCSNTKVARVFDGRVTPVGDGSARLVARAGKLASAPVEVTVRNAKAPPSVEFVNDVMPIFARASCNSTACHGSPVGKGGFKLSLFGYEPDADYQALARDANGRRIDVKAPERSLLLLKPTMGVPHGGGMRFRRDSREYQVLLTWLRAGAPGIGDLEARVRGVEVFPSEAWIAAPNQKQRLAVMAQMSDGTERDVTEKALFASNDDAIADVDADGNVTSRRAGETSVMVRFMGQVAVSRIAVLPADKPKSWPSLAKNNYVDEILQAKQRKLRMIPSELCTDEEFIRRATLDTCGIIPTPEEVHAFLQDSAPDKRARLIDRLLDRPEFVDLWTMKWNDTLRNNPQDTRVGAGPYFTWIREQIAANRPYNQFVRDLLTGSGKSTGVTYTVDMLPPQVKDRIPNPEFFVERFNNTPFNPTTNYYVIAKDPLDATSATSQVFLGVRIECARCHNHPFEKWTQSDYYGLAAFFSRTAVRGGQAILPAIVTTNPYAPALRHPKTNEVVEPKVLDGTDVPLTASQDRRAAVADWITSPTNPWFARELANRLWGYYFGRGIVEPVDDFRVTNPASNPELLDALAKDFVESKFDVKHLHRVILNSRAYQQSSRPNEFNRADTSNFARFYPRRMMAEQLFDSISQATDVFLPGQNPFFRRGYAGMMANNPFGLIARSLQDALPDAPVRRVMQLPNPRVPGPPGQFLSAFGKPRREVVCECERASDGNIGQALALLNGPQVNGKIAAPIGRVQRLVRQGRSEPELVEELYAAALSRRPTDTEREEAIGLIHSASTPAEGAQDLMWSLLNSREFLFIH